MDRQFSFAHDLAFAVHSLFDAQIGPPRGLVEMPSYPEIDGAPLSATEQHLYGDGPYDRFMYDKLVTVGQSEPEALQDLWQDFKFLWSVTKPRARLYWRYADRIHIEVKAFNVIARTRIAIPAEDFILPFGLHCSPSYVPQGFGFYP